MTQLFIHWLSSEAMTTGLTPGLVQIPGRVPRRVGYLRFLKSNTWSK